MKAQDFQAVTKDLACVTEFFSDELLEEEMAEKATQLQFVLHQVEV